MAKLLDDYIKFVSTFTETQNIVHTWSFITAVSALIGRKRYIPFGAGFIYPNMYTMVVGPPATRKSTAIKLVERYCTDIGYTKLAFESGSKESFFNSLARDSDESGILLDTAPMVLDASSQIWEPPYGETHSFICSDEFQEFIGINNMNFLSSLGDLWDRDKDYRYETIKHGVMVIPKPYVTVLGGTTPSTFSNIFPAHAIDQGFLSRLLMIPCGSKARSFAFPPPPDPEVQSYILNNLAKFLYLEPTELPISNAARGILEEIYSLWESPFDSRFAGYAGRRHTHLLKLCIIFSVLNDLEELTKDVVIEAHSLLMYTELLMPDVIGEMGKGPHATAMNLILNTMNQRKEGISLVGLYKLLYREVRSLEELHHVVNLLRVSGRIVTDAEGVNHAIPVRISFPEALKKYVDPKYVGVIQDSNE